VILSRRSKLPVLACCRLLGISRASLYRKRVEKVLDEEALVRLAGAHPRFGYRRLAVLLGVSKKSMRNRMSRLGLMLARRKTRKRTTFPVPVEAPNLCKPATGPGELLVSDFTFIELTQGFAYFAITLDVFTRKVLGWSISRSMKSDFTVEALEMALSYGCLAPNWIHHSDRGSQYASRPFRDKVRALGGTSSFSKPASPAENAFAESFFSRFKDEVISVRECRSYAETVTEVRKHVAEYNEIRQHSSLGDISPSTFEKRHAENALKLCVS